MSSVAPKREGVRGLRARAAFFGVARRWFLLIALPLSVTLVATSCDQLAHNGKIAVRTVPQEDRQGPRPADTAPAPNRAQAARAGSPLHGPQEFPGSGNLVQGSQRPTVTNVNTSGTGDISFNFINADVHDVVREILGKQLHLPYAIDANVHAMVTAQTGAPLKRSAVLPTLENILRANGLEMVQANGVYRILPSQEASKSSLENPIASAEAGYGIRVFPLHFVSAQELKSVLERFMPPGGVLQVDPIRNVMLASGPMADLDGIAQLVKEFDVDWIAGTSFALYPLEVGTAKDIGSELQSMFGDNASGPLAGLVRIVPIDRLNAILVIATQPAYLHEVRSWIKRLDYGDDQMTPRLFEYHVQNSRASDLAAVLTRLFSSGQVSVVRPQIAPGAQAAELMSQQATAPAISGTGSVSNAAPLSSPGLATVTPGGVTGRSAVTPSQIPQRAQNLLGPGSEEGSGSTENALKLPPVRVVADEKNNNLVIYARPRDYKMILDVVRRLDIVPMQVLLEATIAEVTLNDSLSYGLQFFLKHHGSSFELNSALTGGGVAGDIAPVFPGFNYVLSGENTRVILNALSALTHVRVISSPQLLVLDHQTAALEVGDQVPITTQTAQSVINPDSPIVNSIQYVSTGVVLRITPQINSSGLVNLDIDQDVSDVSKTTTSTINSPTITQRHIVSSVVVKDGETVALGGLILNNERNEKSGIPVLSDIPILGNLFGSTTKSTTRTELLVLLSPKIVRGERDARHMTEELQNRMREVEPLERKIR